MGDPVFYTIFDSLYHTVMDPMPEFIQSRDQLSAALLGGGGMLGIVKGLQLLSNNVVDSIVCGFDYNILPRLEKACFAGMLAAPFVYSAIDPVGAKDVMTEHPTYTSGMLGIWAGSLLGAGIDLYRRARQKTLEDIIR